MLTKTATPYRTSFASLKLINYVNVKDVFYSPPPARHKEKEEQKEKAFPFCEKISTSLSLHKGLTTYSAGLLIVHSKYNTTI